MDDGADRNSMIPTSPSSPLKFRTAGFPQYGFKAGLSDSAFPSSSPVKPAPGIPVASVSLLLSFVLSSPVTPRSRSKPGRFGRSAPPFDRPCRSAPGLLAPARVMLSRALIAYSTPSAPLAGTSGLHLPAGLYPMPSLCGRAEATHQWFRAFAVRSFSTCRLQRPREVHRLFVQFLAGR